MKIIRKTAQINVLQKEVSAITEEVEKQDNLIYEIVKYKSPVGYLISPALAQQLVDFLEEKEMLEDKMLCASVIQARKEIEETGGFKFEDVLSEIEN
jgi:hypothetical protein